MSFPGLVRLEIWKLLRRGRTYIGPLGLFAIVIPFAIGFKYGPVTEQEIVRHMSSDVQTFGSPVNALFLMRIVMMPTALLFMPLFVSLVAGDQISGEAAEGTLRAMLTRPVSRLKLILAKYVVSLGYAIALAVFLMASSFAMGWAFFGLGGLVSYWQGLTYFGMQEGLWRLALAYALAGCYQLTVTSIAFLLSVFMNSSLAPVGVTFALLLVFGALGEIPFFEPVRPYLFTTYADMFQRAFEIPVEVRTLMKGLVALGTWSLGAFALAAAVFVRKDILS